MSVALDLNFLCRVIPQARIVGPEPQHIRFCFDSRLIQAGDIFVALPGARVDGHDFLQSAYERGAVGCMIAAAKEDSFLTLSESLRVKLCCIIVQDPQAALLALAHAWRMQFSVPVVGITGSVGKTSTKELLVRMLTVAGKSVLATQGTQNTAVSCALVLLQMTDKHDVVVCEMGISRRGEMQELAALIRPTVALITSLGHSHAEGLGALSDIAAEKRAIFSYFKEDSIGIVNGDMPLLSGVAYRHPLIKFGLKTSNQIQARKIRFHGMSAECVLKIYNQRYQLRIPTHHVGRIVNILAAASLAHVLAVPHEFIVSVAQEPVVVPGRFELKRLRYGSGVMVNDCYNASPESMRAAFLAFERMEVAGAKIVVLGDMLELGASSVYWHRQLGRLLSKAPSVTHVVFVGTQIAVARKYVPHHMHLEHVAQWHDAVPVVKNNLGVDAAVLVKGSRGMQLDRLVAEISE